MAGICVGPGRRGPGFESPAATLRKQSPIVQAKPVATVVATRAARDVASTPQPSTVGGDTQPAVAPRIVVEVDGRTISDRALDQPTLTVGRHSGSDVCVPLQGVSRRHATIEHEQGGWVIKDADSLNGLIYQGHRIDRLTLTDGDCVYITPTAILRYTTAPAPRS